MAIVKSVLRRGKYNTRVELSDGYSILVDSSSDIKEGDNIDWIPEVKRECLRALRESDHYPERLSFCDLL